MPARPPSPAPALQDSKHILSFLPHRPWPDRFKMFRLFGNLWLDDPPERVLTTLDGILPLVHNFEQNITQGK
jgi:hypothetical protein